jgi:hypothetical protein
VNADSPIELVWPNRRAPTGVRTYNDTLLPGEWEHVAGLPVTTVARTAFDLSRRGKPAVALARLDALTRATSVNPAEITAIARHHRYLPGLAQMHRMLELMDAGAASPRRKPSCGSS